MSALLILISIALASKMSRSFGEMHEKIIGHQISSGWIGPSCAECIDGFFIAFALFSGLLLFGLCSKEKRLKTALITIFIPIAFLLFLTAGKTMLVSLAFGAIGLAIGQLIFILRCKCGCKCCEDQVCEPVKKEKAGEGEK